MYKIITGYKKTIWMILLLTLLTAASTANAQSMKIHVINLGNEYVGDAILLESKHEYLLIDTGTSYMSSKILRYLYKHDVKKLSILLTHMHEDHTGGLQALLSSRRIKIKHVYLPTDKLYYHCESHVHDIEKLLKSYKTSYSLVEPGDRLKIGDAKIAIIGPVGSGTKKDSFDSYINNRSLCTMITCSGIKFLSCGDILERQEKALIRKYGKSILKADILKINHHGKGDSNTREWLYAVQPEYVFLSGHSSYKSIIKNKLKKGTHLCVTGSSRKNFVYKISNGRIHFYTD